MRKTTFLIASALSAAVAFTAPYPASAVQHEKSEADDTKMNKQESKQEQSADQQKEAKSDRETTRQIRRTLIKNKSLSTYAHNVKIITQDGKVTLKGPVRSEKEKRTVEKAAVNVAGKENVTNELEVVPKKVKKEKE